VNQSTTKTNAPVDSLPLDHNFEEQSGSSVLPNARQCTRQNGTTVPLVNISAVQQNNPSMIFDAAPVYSPLGHNFEEQSGTNTSIATIN